MRKHRWDLDVERGKTYLPTMTRWWCFDVTGSSSKMLRTDNKNPNWAESFYNVPTGTGHTWTWTHSDFDVVWFIKVTNAFVAGCNGSNSPAVVLTHFCLVPQKVHYAFFLFQTRLPVLWLVTCVFLHHLFRFVFFILIKKAWLAGGFPATANAVYTRNQLTFPVKCWVTEAILTPPILPVSTL